MKMAESKSKPSMHWCETCKVWVSNHVMNIRAHEMSDSHQRKLKANMIEMRQRDIKKNEYAKELDAELARVNLAVAQEELGNLKNSSVDHTEVSSIFKTIGNFIGPQISTRTSYIPQSTATIHVAPVKKAEPVPAANPHQTPNSASSAKPVSESAKKRHLPPSSKRGGHVIDYEAKVAPPSSPSSSSQDESPRSSSISSSKKRLKALLESVPDLPPLSSNLVPPRNQKHEAPVIGSWAPLTLNGQDITSGLFAARVEETEPSATQTDAFSQAVQEEAVVKHVQQQPVKKTKKEKHEVWGGALDW
eukprot:GDKJ01023605.1.p1 GENE.GDKJ01023605.1~~GDKJ01023605.1.p1  ORF type:complete len:312 (-),score=76.64 GDKJ01023605.1:69-980(-)